jgi:hypothetical protein
VLSTNSELFGLLKRVENGEWMLEN